MANEITFSGQLRATKTNLSVNKTISSTRADMAGDAYSAGTQSIPTTAGGTVVSTAAPVTTYGLSVFKNLDATNYLQLGLQVGGTFYAFLKLKPGESSGPMRIGMASGALYALANTGACILEHLIIED